jgi:hypothetical protein
MLFLGDPPHVANCPWMLSLVSPTACQGSLECQCGEKSSTAPVRVSDPMQALLCMLQDSQRV